MASPLADPRTGPRLLNGVGFYADRGARRQDAEAAALGFVRPAQCDDGIPFVGESEIAKREQRIGLRLLVELREEDLPGRRVSTPRGTPPAVSDVVQNGYACARGRSSDRCRSSRRKRTRRRAGGWSSGSSCSWPAPIATIPTPVPLRAPRHEPSPEHAALGDGLMQGFEKQVGLSAWSNHRETKRSSPGGAWGQNLTVAVTPIRRRSPR